jgi:hypothetical protein
MAGVTRAALLVMRADGTVREPNGAPSDHRIAPLTVSTPPGRTRTRQSGLRAALHGSSFPAEWPLQTQEKPRWRPPSNLVALLARIQLAALFRPPDLEELS